MKTFLQRTISCLIIFVCLLACVSVKQVVKAAEYNYTFTSKSFGDSTNSWTSNKDGNQLTSGRGVQVTTGVSGASATTKNEFSNVASIIVTYSTNASKGAGQIAVKIGNGTEISQSVTTSGGTTDRELSFENINQSGKINLKVTCTTNSIYIKSVRIITEEQVLSTDSFKGLNTLASINLEYTVNSFESDSVASWILVEDASSLNAGDEIVIVAANSSYAISNADKTNNRDGVVIEKKENQIVIDETVQVISLENGKVSDTFAFKTEEGYFYAASSSNNYLKAKSTLDNNGSWSITINSGIATIKSQGSYSRNVIRFNPNNGSPLFSCYGSGQEDVSVYKKVVSSGIANEYIIKENSVSLRFGTLVPAEIYEDLLSQGYKFGVNFVSGTKNKDFICANIEKVTVEDKEYYQYAVVINNIPVSAYKEEFAATCFAELNGEQVKMNSKTHSVVSILAAYVEMAESSEKYYGSLDKDLMAGLLTAANK